MHLLFLCVANSARSQLAEALAWPVRSSRGRTQRARFRAARDEIRQRLELLGRELGLLGEDA